VRFHVGPVPESGGFAPAEQGWEAMREPNPQLMQLVGLPFLALGVGLTIVAISELTNIDLRLPSAPRLLLICLTVVPVHELIHVACYPRNQPGNSALIGFWPRRLAFYAHFDGAMRRNRFIAILLAPTLALTAVPVAFAACAGCAFPLIGEVAVANSVFAYGDLFGVFLVAIQVPRTAWVRNKGWRTYWRNQAPDAD
jgi:hypothetical protein